MKPVKHSFSAKDSNGNLYVIDQVTPVIVSQSLDGLDHSFGAPKFTHKGHPVKQISRETFYITHLNTQVDKVL
jgi:hypothetical protein